MKSAKSRWGLVNVIRPRVCSLELMDVGSYPPPEMGRQGPCLQVLAGMDSTFFYSLELSKAGN